MTGAYLWRFKTALLGIMMTAALIAGAAAITPVQAQEAEEEGSTAGETAAAQESTPVTVEAYRRILTELDNLQGYNTQLVTLIDAQKDEMKELQRQLSRADTIDREVVPLMFQMIDSLETFINLDVPFRIQERRSSVDNLKEIMGRSDLTAADKYREIMEVYQRENEYGRTISAYQGELAGAEGGAKRTVNFLRIGRIVLIYQTLDGDEIAVWDQASRSWQPLGINYRLNVTNALRVAREQAAPDLLILPVQGPGRTQVSEAAQ